MGILTLITPASDLGLLSMAELRVAVGLADSNGSRDTSLTTLGLQVAGQIARFCGVAPAGVAVPTLRSEMVEEVWRLTTSVEALILSRRFVSAIATVSVSGVAIDSSFWELDGPAGLLRRLDSSDRYTRWAAGSKVTVRYAAGFAAVPDDLKACAVDLVRMADSVGDRDPLLRAQQWEGIGREEYQIVSGMAMEGGMPKDIASRLSAYMSDHL